MNKIGIRLIGGVMVTAVVVIVTLAVALTSGTDGAGRSGRGNANGQTVSWIRTSEGKRKARSIRIRPQDSRVGIGGSQEAAVTEEAAEEPVSEDEKLVQGVIDELLKEIESAARSGDVKTLRKLLEKIRAQNHGWLAKGGRGVTSSVKCRLLQALSGGGAAVIDQIVGFLGDSDPVVVDKATDAVFGTLHDLSLGDLQRADIIVAAAQEMTDLGSLERLYNQFMRLRPSVALKTTLQIEASGTDAARELLPRTFVYTGAEASVKTIEAFKDYASGVNPEELDPEDADRQYGGLRLDGANSR